MKDFNEKSEQARRDDILGDETLDAAEQLTALFGLSPEDAQFAVIVVRSSRNEWDTNRDPTRGAASATNWETMQALRRETMRRRELEKQLDFVGMLKKGITEEFPTRAVFRKWYMEKAGVGRDAADAVFNEFCDTHKPTKIPRDKNKPVKLTESQMGELKYWLPVRLMTGQVASLPRRRERPKDFKEAKEQAEKIIEERTEWRGDRKVVMMPP